MDLAPRPVEPAAAAKRKRSWLAIGVLVAIVAVGGFVVSKFLTESLDYFCNVDEVGHKSGCAGTSPIRLQGAVKEGSRQVVDGQTTFQIVHNHVELPVRYHGTVTSELFQDCVNVIVHGQLRDGVFESDNVTVKHSEEYQNADDPALKASKRSAACLQQR